MVTPFGKLKNVVSPQVVTLADVVPTVLDMAGLPIPAEVQGRSLVPLFFAPEKEIPGIGFAYSETYYPRFHYGWSDLKSYQDRRFELILAPDLELYDVAADPREQKNLASENPRPPVSFTPKPPSSWSGRRATPCPSIFRKWTRKPSSGWPPWGTSGRSPTPPSWRARSCLNPREKIGVFNALNKSREMGMTGKVDEAVRAIQAIISDDPELVDAYFSLGNIYFKEKRYKDAIQAFGQALALKPDDSFTVINMANCMAALGRTDEAEKTILDFLAKGFEDSQLYHLLGGLNFTRKRYDQAIVYFNKCLTLNSESAASHNSLAAIYIVKGDLDKAEGHIREALRTNARLHTLYFNWAQLYEKRNDLPRAAEAYAKEMEISPRNFRACFNLARVYRQMGRDEDELTYLNKTKALNPDFALTYFYLARIELNRGQDYNAAVALAQKGWPSNPSRPIWPWATSCWPISTTGWGRTPCRRNTPARARKRPGPSGRALSPSGRALAAADRSRLQIVDCARQEDVESHSRNADGLVRPDLEMGPARIVDEDVVLADHLEGLIRPYDNSGGFVDPDAQQGRVLGQHADQPVVPLAHDEMLIDDRAVDEAQPRRRDDVFGRDRLEFVSGLGRLDLVAGDHDLAHDGRPGARSADDRSVFIDLQELAVDGRSQQGFRHPGLVAAGEIDAADAVQDGGRLRLFGFFPGQDAEFDVFGPQPLQLLDHIRPGFGRRRSGHGKDQNAARIHSFGQGDELPGHIGVAVAAADDEQPPLGGRRGGQGQSQGQSQEEQESFFHVFILARIVKPLLSNVRPAHSIPSRDSSDGGLRLLPLRGPATFRLRAERHFMVF